MTNLYRTASLLSLACVAFPLAAQQSAPGPAMKAQIPTLVDGVAAEDIRTLTATVEAIDQVKRTITLQGELGRSVTLKVDSRVKNFAQVKVGDQIVLKYVEALSVKLEKGVPDTAASYIKTGPVAAPPGSKPGVISIEQTVIVANVESVDPKLQEILLKGPMGRYVEVKVKDPSVFAEIQVGDKVKATYSEALIVDVFTPTANK
jgi:hypothetical protein